MAAVAGLLFVASHVTASGTDLRTGGVEDLRDLVIFRAGNVARLAQDVGTLDVPVQNTFRVNKRQLFIYFLLFIN
jgi:hypothetical protein